MITVALDVASLARVRLAPSPLHEASSWLAWTASGRRHPLWGDPGAAARFALRDRDVAVAAALLRDGVQGGYVPDFLTPKPPAESLTRLSLEDQLQRVQATPADVVHEQLRRTRSLPTRWYDAADQLPVLATAGLARFWRAAAADMWVKAADALRRDQNRRMALAASAGLGSMLSSLHPTLRWTGGTLVIDKPYDEHIAYVDAEIVLVPSLTFASRLSVQVCNPADAVLVFPVSAAPPQAKASAAALLGRGRAAVLKGTSRGASTIDLSRDLDLSAATVSHHLKVLYGAGLVDRIRNGHRVIYTRTEAGDRILADCLG